MAGNKDKNKTSSANVSLIKKVGLSEETQLEKNANHMRKQGSPNLIGFTQKQHEYIAAIENHDQVLAFGPAGTGKTFIPSMMASDMFNKDIVKKIIITRPTVAVAKSDELGHLPGDLEAKLEPWAVPIVEIMKEAINAKDFNAAVTAKDIEVAPFQYMRGRTFDNAFIILDEAQNATLSQLEMFLTRIGKNSKFVICGDVGQTDLGGKSGLPTIISMIEKYHLPVSCIEFSPADVVRSQVAAQWVDAFAKHRKDTNLAP